ncbi:germacrene-D synthase-like [Sesamum indicum]|uniref:Germacrene-D synthase-like n=1 Tax=Sesamum indicum TaxID=4182 RepID=A0A6I9UMV7_SESIN|nr:germacrene-D synthase-like [Sesamum indicum]
MEFDSSNSSILIKKVDEDDIRESFKYHPSVWGDYFLAYVSTEISVAEEEELGRQKEMVRKVLAQTPDHSYHKLEFIDAIQRLGVGYHFEEEIDKFVHFIHDTYLEYSSKDNDLRTVALRFRLLRQHGYLVSCDIFNKFTDGEGNFKISLIKNLKGMLELFEAAQFRIAGEEILEKALQFSSNLESLVSNMNCSISTKVKEALKIPILKSSNRVGAKKFISIYQQDESHSEMLLNFAKLDFNIVQKTHQKELSDFTRWWKDLDFVNRLPFARDRMVECYFWALEVYFEPHYHIARRMLTKIINMTSILDDIYDVYGTLDDLQLFTDLIQRWDVNALEQLPSYMRICYEALSDVYIEIENELEKTGESYRVQYAKEEMKKLVRAYIEEAKWSYNKDMPRMEEYMKVAIVSSTYMMLLTTSLVGMGNLVTKKDFDWITSEPLLLLASATICRLTNDLVGYGFEKKSTAVECYMNENDASKEEAFAELGNQITKAWKDINQECLQPMVPISMSVLTRALNLACATHLFYLEYDEYSNSQANIKNIIHDVLLEPNVMI